MQNRLFNDVENLALPGTRNVGSHGHQLAINFLVSRMAESGLMPYSGEDFKLPYQVEMMDYTNLAGVLPGLDRSLDPILLIAHYDTCGDQPGADDNAAAIAIWLDALHALKRVVRQRDIIVLFPDAEEPPRFLSEHMGSSNFYNRQLKGNIHAGLVLDLVGHDVALSGMEELLFIFGAESHRSLADTILRTELPPGLKSIATLNRYVGDLSDHHVLRENGCPYLFFTCGRWEHYHQQTDIPEHLNYSKMELISQYLMTLIRQLDYCSFDKEGYGVDSVNMELALLKRAIGPYLVQEGIPMESRADIQDFVLMWVQQHQL